jgi:hypothetical protein
MALILHGQERREVQESDLAVDLRLALQASEVFRLRMGISVQLDPLVQESDLVMDTPTAIQLLEAF